MTKTSIRIFSVILAAMATMATAQRTVFQVDRSTPGTITDFSSFSLEERVDAANLGGSNRDLSSIEIFVGNAATAFGAVADIEVRIYDAAPPAPGNAYTPIWSSSLLAQPLTTFADGGSSFLFEQDDPMTTITLPSTVYYGVVLSNISSGFIFDTIGPVRSEANPVAQGDPTPSVPLTYWTRAAGSGDYVAGVSETEFAMAAVIRAVPEPGIGAQVLLGAAIISLVRRLRERRS